MSNYISMSATRMNTFLQCKFKYWCQYVAKLPKKPNPAFKLGIACHGALECAGRIWMEKESFDVADIKRIKDEYRRISAEEGVENYGSYESGLQMVLSRLNDFDYGKIITIEDHFKVTTPEGVPVIGAMDKVCELNDESLLVVDYKTSKYTYTPAELKQDIQLSMYDLIASLKYPDYKRIILSLDYLRDAPVYSYRTLQERVEFSKYLLYVYQEMIKLTEDKAEPVLNDMCNWCDFNESCPVYLEAGYSKGVFNKNLNDMSDDELAVEFNSIKSRKRVLDEYEKKLKKYILNKITQEGDNVKGDGRELYVNQRKNTKYSTRALYEAMPFDTFIESVSPNNEAVNRFLVSNPSKKTLIERDMSIEYTNSFLSYRTIKK